MKRTYCAKYVLFWKPCVNCGDPNPTVEKSPLRSLTHEAGVGGEAVLHGECNRLLATVTTLSEAYEDLRAGY